MSYTTVYTFILWLAVGALCTLFSEKRGLLVGASLPVAVELFPFIFWVNRPDPQIPTFQWFRFGHEFSGYLDRGIAPVLGALVGGLLVLWLLPVDEEPEG